MAIPGQPTLSKRAYCELTHDYCLLGAINDLPGDKRYVGDRVAAHPSGETQKTTGGKGGKPRQPSGVSDSSTISIIEPGRFPPLGAGGKRRKVPARKSGRKMAERVGFEPTVRLHAHRFSRPSRSTTLAPLRGPAYRGAIPSRQPRPNFPISAHNQGFPALTWGASCVYSALLRRVIQARRALSCFPAFGAWVRSIPLPVVGWSAGSARPESFSQVSS